MRVQESSTHRDSCQCWETPDRQNRGDSVSVKKALYGFLILTLMAQLACSDPTTGMRATATPFPNGTPEPADVSTRTPGATPAPTTSPTPPIPTATAIPANSGTATETPAALTSPDRDREALVALFQATDGPHWRNNENWLSAAEIGDWHGVTADAAGRVIALDLSSNHLDGELPSELGGLANLTELNLGGNRLIGAIPPELGNLANLEVLRLGWNDLTGNIPAELGNLGELRELDLDGYQLSGAIPPELGRLSNLVTLSIASTDVGGRIPPELGNLTNLEVLKITSTDVGGRIPPELGGMTNLKELSLRKNRLEDEIPSELGALSNLEVLDLYANELSGNIPAELGRLTNLRKLVLGLNRLSAEIPAELGNLARLEVLHIGMNELTGEIPPQLGDLANLRNMDLGSNRLEGELPPELSNLRNVVVLRLVANRLSGEIPPELSNLGTVEELYLANNQLTGEIPPELGDLGRLLTLALGGNALSGCIPDSLRIHYYLAEELELEFCAPSAVSAADDGRDKADFLGPNTEYIDPALVALLYGHAAGEATPAKVRLAIGYDYRDIAEWADLEAGWAALEAYIEESGGTPDGEYIWLMPIGLVPSVMCRPDVAFVDLVDPDGTPSWKSREKPYHNLNDALSDVVVAHQGGMPENQAALYALFVRGNSVVVIIQVPNAETEGSVLDWLAQRKIYVHPDASSSDELYVVVLLPVGQILPLAQRFSDAYLEAEEILGQGLPMLRSQWSAETLHLEKAVTQQFLSPDSDAGRTEPGGGITPCSSDTAGR